MKQRKVLFVVESLAGGGAEKVLTVLVRNLNPQEFDVTVCALVDVGVYKSQIPSWVKYHSVVPDIRACHWSASLWPRLKYHMVYHWLPLRWVYRLFIPQGNDVEVAFVEGFVTKLLSRSSSLKSKKIAWVHIDLKENHWTRSVFKTAKEESCAYARFHQIVAVSNLVRQSLVSLFSELKTPIQTLYNPIDEKEIIRLVGKRETNEGKKRMRLVSVGRFVPQKAYLRLLHVFAALVTDGWDLELWLLGEGPERAALENYIRSEKLTDRVTLLGFQTNPYAYMNQCDLFVCSSLAEGYSTAVTEALVLGLPVVTTRCAGMQELLQDGKFGLITDNTEEALYRGLKEVLQTPVLFTHYKQMAEERSREFSLSGLMKPIENLLNS